VPRAGLTTDVVVDIALALVDEKGLEVLSLAAVADRAGVATPSLYKHVGSLADLRDLMAGRIIRQVTGIFGDSAVGRSRDDAVTAVMHAYRAYVLANPGRYALIPFDPLRRPDLAEASADLLNVFVAVLRGYGLDDEQTTHAIRRMRATVHGFADIEARGGFGQPEDIDKTYEGVIAMFLKSLP
jgi:AcrR family transcriptional regulator